MSDRRELGDTIADAYQLAGAILAELPDDPRHVELLDLLHEAAERTAAAPPGLLTLLEAEKESGIKASTLRVQLNAGRLKGVKRGRDWYVDATALLNYLESRSPRGRPPASGARRRP